MAKVEGEIIDTNDLGVARSRGKWSGWWVMVAPNKRFWGGENGLPTEERILKAKSFKQLLTQVIYDHLANIEPYLEYGHWVDRKGKKTDEDFIRDRNQNQYDLVDMVNFEIAGEIGPTTGAVHAHFTLKIRHRTSIKLNNKRLQADIAQALGLTSIAMMVQQMNVTSKYLEDYLKKTEAKDDELDKLIANTKAGLAKKKAPPKL